MNGLHKVNHWVAALEGGGDLDEVAADPLSQRYHALDRFVLGTVCDGNCGLDVMTQMLQWPQTDESRCRMRQQLYDYVMQPHTEPWLHDMLVLTQELSAEEVQKFRELDGDHDDSWLEDPGGGGPWG